jgi:hypothetical protein
LSELPERKVLKETLAKLKSKSHASFLLYNWTIKAFNENLKKQLDEMRNSMALLNEEEKRKVGLLLLLIGVIANEFNQVILQSIDTIDDFSTYTDVLERYSTELDNTLIKIFEEANKLAEEQVKKKKELTGKTDYTI